MLVCDPTTPSIADGSQPTGRSTASWLYCPLVHLLQGLHRSASGEDVPRIYFLPRFGFFTMAPPRPDFFIFAADRRARSACISSKSAAPGDVAVGDCAAG